MLLHESTGLEMSSFTNNNAFGVGGNQGPSSYHTSTTRQHASPIGNSSSGNPNWIGGPHQESYMPTGLATTSPWPNNTFTGFPASAGVYGGSAWPGNQHLDLAPFGPSVGGLRSDSLMGFEVAPPVLEQALPVMLGALPASHPGPPDWAQAPGPPRQPSLHARPGTQNGVHRSIGSPGMRPEIPHFRQAASLTAGPPERRVVPTTPHSVRPLAQNDPVLAAPSTFRRWNVSDLPLATFPCLWGSGGTQCTALIAGDRRCVTSHLRDAHDFACDGLTIVCAWDQCKTPMQRRNIPRHVVACHLEIKVTCERCGMELSRADANKKHQLACTGST